MKLRSDGLRLCIVIGLALAFFVVATPAWASAAPASQTKQVRSGVAPGISPASWLDALWSSLRAAVGDAGAGIDLDDHTLVDPEEKAEPLLSVSEPPESSTTEEGPSIDIDG